MPPFRGPNKIYYQQIQGEFLPVKVILIRQERRTAWGELICTIQSKATFFREDPEGERKFLRDHSLEHSHRRQQGIKKEGRHVEEEETTITTREEEHFRFSDPESPRMAFGEDHWSARAAASFAPLPPSSPHYSMAPLRGDTSRQTLVRDAIRMRRAE